MQYEAGIHSRFGSLLALELAGFHIEKSNIVQKFGKNADGKSVIGQVGTVHSDGFEIDATLTPSPPSRINICRCPREGPVWPMVASDLSLKPSDHS